MIGQKEYYNGHHKTHAVCFQSIVRPDGLVHDLAGPYKGATNDCSMYKLAHTALRMTAVAYRLLELNPENGIRE